jgi:hypothetical protein
MGAGKRALLIMRIELSSIDGVLSPRGRVATIPFVIRYLAERKSNRVASSLRIPVTPANRARLRNLRAAEAAAWLTLSGPTLEHAATRRVRFA